MKIGVVRYFIAIVLIGFGLLLILDNIGVLETNFSNAWHVLYPLFFVIVGLRLLIHYFKNGVYGWVMGSFLFIFGLLLLLGQFEVIEYQFKDIFKLWPLLIVYIGFSIVNKSQHHKSRVKISRYDSNHQKSTYKNRPFFSSVGNHEYKEDNWKVEPMYFSKAAGDFYFDFTKAFIPQENIPITIHNWAGDVQMLLPDNLDFSIEARVKAGDINVLGQKLGGVNRDINYKSTNYDDAQQKLTLLIDVKAGSIRVDRV